LLATDELTHYPWKTGTYSYSRKIYNHPLSFTVIADSHSLMPNE